MPAMFVPRGSGVGTVRGKGIATRGPFVVNTPMVRIFARSRSLQGIGRPFAGAERGFEAMLVTETKT